MFPAGSSDTPVFPTDESGLPTRPDLPIKPLAGLADILKYPAAGLRSFWAGRPPPAEALMLSGSNIQTPSSASPAAPAAFLTAPPAAISSIQSLSQLEGRLAEMQEEVSSLTLELSAVRRRDLVFQSHMNRINDELRLAARLQQDFLPKQLPQLGRVRFHALFRPASYVSGDLYDAMRLDEEHVGFYMADAVGHGVPAALLTMYVKRALVTKEILPQGYRLLSPAEAIGRINDAITEQDLSQAACATVIYGMINIQTLELRFARGGHPQPLLISPGEPLQMLECEGPLLGILPSDCYVDCTRQLKPGDRVLIYTDGVEVAFGQGDANNLDRWLEEIEKRRHLSSPELLQDFCRQIDNEAGSLQPIDDLTALIIEILP